jgi:DNA helicase-2/ATP-dependent DNA helicase PcrA
MNIETKIIDGFEWLFAKPLDETELKAMQGKHCFFSAEREKLAELAKDFLKKGTSKFTKVSTEDGNIGKDYVLCVYTRDNSLKDSLIREFEKDKGVEYKGWKADSDTEKGKYSLQFKENAKRRFEQEMQKSKKDFLKNLNPQQKKAANYNGKEKFLFVRAGAGCGKTRTIIARYLSLVEMGVNPKSIVLVTFTNKAANEMKERIEKIGIEEPLFVGTFHGLCLKLINKFSSNANRKWIVLDEHGQEELMKLAMKEKNEEHERIYPDFEGIDFKHFKPKTVLKLYGKARESLRTLDDILNEWKNKIRGIVEEVCGTNRFNDYFYKNNKKIIDKARKKFDTTEYNEEYADMITDIVNNISEEKFDVKLQIDYIKTYEKLKKEGGYLDFVDMLVKMNELLQHGYIKEWFKEKFEIIIDEMQDTNPLQLQFLEKIYGTSNIFCVGDPAQAIFEFRGVNANEYKDYKKRFPNYKEFSLSENYRSINHILRLSNWLLKDTEYKIELKSAKNLKGNLPIVKDFKKPEDEVQWVVKHIKKSIGEGINVCNIKILLREMKNIFAIKTIKLLQAKLKRAKINFAVHGGRIFFKQEHIINLFACLRFALYQDRVSLISYLTIWKGIGQKTAENILGMAKEKDNKFGIDILKTIRNNPAAYNCIKDIQTNRYDFYSAVETSIKYLLDEYKNKNETAKNPKTDDEMKSIKEDLDIMLRESSEYNALEDFVNAMTLDTPSQETKDKLIISTVHSAKGTEAELVYVLQAFQYPRINSYEQKFERIYDIEKTEEQMKHYKDYKKAENEELRILYVALTRAKQKLILTSCGDIFKDEKIDYPYYLHSLKEWKCNTYIKKNSFLANLPKKFYKKE